MSSDYEPHGSISNSQIAPQRKPKDTYFGELILQKQKTGESIAQLMKNDIFEGSTAQIRRYKKKGIKYQFNATISFPNDYDNSQYETYMENDTGVPVDKVTFSQKDNITGRKREIARYSMQRGMYMESTATGVGFINDSSGTPVEVESFNESGQFVVLVFVGGATETTSIPGSGASAIADIDGYYAEYTSGTKSYFYYANDSRFADAGSTSFPIDVLPIVSFQDNFNGELPYEQTFAPEDWEFIRRQKTMRGLGVDFETMSRQVFSYIPKYVSPSTPGYYAGSTWNRTYGTKYNKSPKLQAKYKTEQNYHDELAKEVNIPAYQSPEWNKNYGRSYRSNMKNCRKDPRPEQAEFCRDNPTELAYYNGLVQDKQKAYDNQKNITDVHFGVFASAKKLDEESCVALFYTLKPAFPLMNPVPNNNVKITHEDGTTEQGKVYRMSVHVGSLKIDYSFNDWSLCRRYGVADPIMYPPGVRSAKYKHGDFTVHEGSLFFGGGGSDSPPPTWDEGDKYNERDNSYIDTRAPSDLLSVRGGMLELRVQDRPDANGRPRFQELRMYAPMAKHVVDVIRDGEHNKSGTTLVAGGLYNYWSTDSEKPYSDVLIWPITYEAAREIRIFRRERFLRECTMMNIGAVKMEEIKWYQQGWFKIVMIIVTLVISYFFPPFGIAVGISGVLASAAIIAVLYIVSMVVENPIIRAIIAIILLVITYDVSSFAQLLNPALLVEAAGIVVQTKIALDMIELQEEMREFREMVNKKEKEMKKMKEEVGMDEYNADWILYIASLAPVEAPEDFYSRATNTDLTGLSLEGADEVSLSVPAPQS